VLKDNGACSGNSIRTILLDQIGPVLTIKVCTYNQYVIYLPTQNKYGKVNKINVFYINYYNLLGESSEGQNGLHPINLSFCNGDSQVQRESSVKDLTQKLTNLRSPDESPTKLAPPLDDMRGIISKAMEGM